MKAYKQFAIDKYGKLHPLFVNAKDEIPVGRWIMATEGRRTEAGKVVSKLGPLAYRPGWHLSEIPYAPHIGIKENGKIKYMKPRTVWAECEVYDENDWTAEARANGVRGTRFEPRKACLNHIPYGGYYWFNTNPSAFGNWLIAERIMVTRILTDEQTEEICWKQFGIHAQPRKVA